MDQALSDIFETNQEDASIVLSCGQVGEMLSQYANDALSMELATSIDTHLEGCEACSCELGMLRAEDELLVEAVSDIRPDPSFRAKVGQVCSEAIRHAEWVANSLPERGWALFRWGLATLAVVHFIVLSLLLEPPTTQGALSDLEMFGLDSNSSSNLSYWDWISEMVWQVVEARPSTYWINVFLFLLALFLLIGGRLVATFERWLARRIGEHNPGPSRLAVLTLETLGVGGVVATSVFYFIQLTQ